MENEQSEEPKQEIEGAEKQVALEVKSDKQGSTNAVIKLVVLVLLAFLVVKYGVPLMNQISEKSTEVLGKETDEKAISPEEMPAEVTPNTSSIIITKGYENWESAVREQLDDWVEDGLKYKLISIEVNDTKELMEIRYRTQNKEGFEAKEKLLLQKDGFGERFNYTKGDKEFLVRPPQ